MQPGRPPRALVLLYGGAPRSPVLRSHELGRHFADRLPVIYVPFRSPVEWLFGDWRYPEWKPLTAHPNVRIVGMPLTTSLSRRSAAAAALHGGLAAAGIRQALRSLGVRPEEAVLFAESAAAAPIIDRFPEAPVFYDCADDLVHWHGASPAMQRLYAGFERRVAERASWIAVTIPRLAERFSELGAEVIQSSNGVDPGFFRPAPAPADLAAIPEPRLLLLGVLSRFVCAETIAALADSGVGELALVGPLDPRAPVRRLRGHPRVHFLGRREYAELPGYAWGAQVGLIPGTAAAASDCVPAKLFMYCAAGLPVVGHDCSSLRPFGSLVRLAGSPESLVREVREALQSPDEGRSERVELARGRTWERIAAELLDRMGVSPRK